MMEDEILKDMILERRASRLQRDEYLAFINSKIESEKVPRTTPMMMFLLPNKVALPLSSSNVFLRHSCRIWTVRTHVGRWSIDVPIHLQLSRNIEVRPSRRITVCSHLDQQQQQRTLVQVDLIPPTECCTIWKSHHSPDSWKLDARLKKSNLAGIYVVQSEAD